MLAISKFITFIHKGGIYEIYEIKEEAVEDPKKARLSALLVALSSPTFTPSFCQTQHPYFWNYQH